MNHDVARRIERLERRLRGIPIHTEPRYLLTYSYDATGIRGDCGGVAFPGGLGDLAKLVNEANRNGVPLYPRGAGSGYTGGAIPLGGGLVVSTERMRRVIRFDPDAQEVEVESGLVNQELQDYLAPAGFFYPPDPASLKVSTLGGNIAENSGGPRAYKYGVTRRYVRSLTWVTAAGETLSTPAEDTSALLIGSEGTMGIIYSARLSVLPLPTEHRTSLVAAGRDEEAMGIATALLSTGFTPSVFEFIDSKTMACVSEYREIAELTGDSSYLFFEVDGSAEEVAGQQALLEEFCGDRALELKTARNEQQRELLWELRRSVSPSLARRGVTKVNEDVALPLGKLVEAVPWIHGLARELELDCYIFGHCGDGNLHVNIMTDRRRSEEMQRVEQFVERLFRRVIKVGGTLSGEHGIGITKNRYLGLVFTPDEITLQNGIKRAIDERKLMNPGKYFSGGGAGVHR